MRILLLTCLALALPVIASPSAVAAKPGIAALLTRQADAWDKAIVHKDIVAIESNMAGDFRQIAGNGQVADRKLFLKLITDPALTLDPYEVEELDVRVYGDVALLSGETHLTGSYNGKPFKSHYRYTDVYVRHAGTWKVASVQITEIDGAGH